MPGFFVIIFCLYLAGNLYVFIRGWKAISGLSLPTKIIIGVLYWLCAFLLFASFRNRGWGIPDKLAHILYLLGSVWLLFTLYMTLLLLATDILKLVRLRWKYSFWGVLGLTIFVLLYGSYQYNHPKVAEINLEIDKSLNQSKGQLRIVAFSDVHLGMGTGKDKLKKYVKLVNEQQPDLILIGGDLIDNSLEPLYAEHMEEELSELKAPLGIYMALGNHEYFGGGIANTKKFLELTPIILLQDSMVTLPNGLQILGRDDRRAKNRKPLSEWKNRINQDRPVILIDHQPYDLENIPSAGIDLQFSGHTHRGQVWPLSWIADHMFELSYGYKRFGGSQIYVSSGLSLWGPPFRIGTNSEIVVFNLQFK